MDLEGCRGRGVPGRRFDRGRHTEAGLSGVLGGSPPGGMLSGDLERKLGQSQGRTGRAPKWSTLENSDGRGNQHLGSVVINWEFMYPSGGMMGFRMP